jgi:hypothetical protein
MKRFVGLSLFFAGAIFIIFLVNLFLYSFNPKYHSAMVEAVTGKEEEEIPVVDINRDFEFELSSDENVINRDIIYEEMEDEDIPLSAIYLNGNDAESDEEANAPVIIDKEYHEDCGTGEGYWIIRYEDGTVEIE